jgi:hypothetical protein
MSESKPTKIIISYRRSSYDAMAGRIRDKLAVHYGNDVVYMDVDNIPFGIDFREHINQALSEADVLVAIIGHKWLGQRKGQQARLFDTADPVRVEIETALERGIPIVPILVEGATMPKPEDLPHIISKLAFHNAASVDDGRDFHQHMERVIRSLDSLLEAKSKLSTPSRSSNSILRASTIVEPSSSRRDEGSRSGSGHDRGRSWLLIGVLALLCVGIFGITWHYIQLGPSAEQPNQSDAARPPSGPQLSSGPGPVQPTSSGASIQKLIDEISYTDGKNDRSIISSVVDVAIASKSANERDNIVAVLKEQLIHGKSTRLDSGSRLVRKLLLEGIVKIRDGDVWRDFPRGSLSNMDLVGVDLRNVNAKGVNFTHSFLLGSDFRQANLRGAQFSSAALRQVNFENADVSGAAFDGADWFNAIGFGINQLQAMVQNQLLPCPTTADGIASIEAFVGFANSRYRVQYLAWSQADQQVSTEAWSKYMQAGGLCELIKRSN